MIYGWGNNMTLEKLKEANDLVLRIKEKKQQKENIKDLIRRMERITGPYAKYVAIKLGEDYIHTPIANVSVDDFRDFISKQKLLIDSHIEALEKQLEEL